MKIKTVHLEKYFRFSNDYEKLKEIIKKLENKKLREKNGDKTFYLKTSRYNFIFKTNTENDYSLKKNVIFKKWPAGIKPAKFYRIKNKIRKMEKFLYL